MKKIHPLSSLGVFAALLLTSAVCAEPPTTPPATSAPVPAQVPTEADKVAAEISTQIATTRPPGGLSREALEEWIRVNGDVIVGRMQDFMARYPQHESRWRFELILTNVTRKFIGPDAKQQDAAWTAQREAYTKEILTSPDVPRQFVRDLEFRTLRWDLSVAGKAIESGRRPELGSIRARLDAFATKWPDLPLGSCEVEYALLQDKVAATGNEHLSALLKHPNPAIVKAAQAALDREHKIAKPIEMKFTALDGREVDVAKLHGKVVLIDFWATWCGPCLAELPNVRKAYETYHDKGFEIIGISLDRESDRQKLIEFIAKNAMPWPQHFDGKYWSNEFARQYNIAGIPATLLLDQQGMVVSTEAKGPKLEAEIKRLLKL